MVDQTIPVHLVNESIKFLTEKDEWDYAAIIASITATATTVYLAIETRRATNQTAKIEQEKRQQAVTGVRRAIRSNLKNLIVVLGQRAANPGLNDLNLVGIYNDEFRSNFDKLEVQSNLTDEEYTALDDFQKQLSMYTVSLLDIRETIKAHDVSYVDKTVMNGYYITARLTIWMLYNSMKNVIPLFIGPLTSDLQISVDHIRRDEVQFFEILENMTSRTKRNDVTDLP